MSILRAALVALTALAPGASLAAPVDVLFVESNGFRTGSSGDILSDDIGAIAPGMVVGIAGRIVDARDIYTFSTTSRFSILFTDLELLPNDDDVQGFDPDFDKATKKDVPSPAVFSLTGQPSVTFTSGSAGPGTYIFKDIAPGSYTFEIDGSISKKQGSAYDIAIQASPVPVPAALPLLLSAVGGLGLMRRKRRAA